MVERKPGDDKKATKNYDMSSILSAALADAEALAAEKDREQGLETVQQVVAEREAAGTVSEGPAIRGMTIEQVAELRGVSVEQLAAGRPEHGPPRASSSPRAAGRAAPARPTPSPPSSTTAPTTASILEDEPPVAPTGTPAGGGRGDSPMRGQIASLNGQLADARRRAEQLEAQVTEVRGDLAANRRRFQRMADRHDEVQARMQRQEQELPGRITQNVIEALLPVFDGLDAVVGSLLVGGHLDTDERTALEMLASEHNKALQNLGIQAFDAVGHAFDPAVHEAISKEARAEVAQGRVVRQVGRGYLLNGRLMRSAQVVIATAPSDDP